MAVYVKDKSSRSISIGPTIPATSPKENANTTPRNSGAATGAGDEFIYIPHIGQGYQYPVDIAWDVVVSAGGTLAALVVNLEVSDDDGTTWSTLDSNASPTGGRRVVSNTLAKRLRANIATFTINAGLPVVTVGITC